MSFRWAQNIQRSSPHPASFLTGRLGMTNFRLLFLMNSSFTFKTRSCCTIAKCRVVDEFFLVSSIDQENTPAKTKRIANLLSKS